MRHHDFGDGRYVIRLDPGEDLLGQLGSFASEMEIEAGHVTGIGSVDKLTLGFLDPEAKEYEKRTFDEPMEVAQLTASISTDGDRPMIHAHVVVAPRELLAYAGHVHSARVGGRHGALRHEAPWAARAARGPRPAVQGPVPAGRGAARGGRVLPMKTLVLVTAGASDRPLEELGGRTPLEAAQTPHLDRLAQDGRLGRLATAPDGFRPEEGAFALSLFGLDPLTYGEVGGVLDAAAFGVDVGSLDQVFRLALVTADDTTIFDPTAGHVSRDEAVLLLDALGEVFSDPDLAFLPGSGWRNVLLWKGARDVRVRTHPPFEVVGKSLHAAMPRGTGIGRLLAAIERSAELFAGHEVNECRRDLGENGNMVCGVMKEGAMFRVGKEREAEALELGAEPLSFTGRKMGGMVEIDEGAFADDDLRRTLVELSLFNAASLPPKG